MGFRYHNDWRSETQTVVSLVAFLHWLETGALLIHAEAEKKLGCEPSYFSFYFFFVFFPSSFCHQLSCC